MASDPPSGTGRRAPLDAPALETAALPPSQPQHQGAPPPQKALCRYFGQSSGCRSGAACPFRHEVLDTAQRSTAAMPTPASTSQPSRPLHLPDPAGGNPIVPPGNAPARQRASVNTSRITHRPLPQSQLADPRAYQLSQLRRRFAPEERDRDGQTLLTFRLRPSDPDFPFEMDALHCTLRVPSDYPAGKPTLRVTNPDMARGYQINVEQGFDRIVAAASASSTLLAHLNALDKQLEKLLSSEKADTIKIVSHPRRPGGADPTSAPIAEHGRQPPTAAATGAHSATHDTRTTSSIAAATTTATATAAGPADLLPKPVSSAKAPTNIVAHSAEQRMQASQLREAEIRQLEARLGKLPQFSRSRDGIEFTIPVEPRRRNDLPVELRAVKLVKLIVPESYNLLPCRLQLVGVTGEAAHNVEHAFHTRATQAPTVSLLNHINYLTQNMKAMALAKAKETDSSSIDHSQHHATDATSVEPVKADDVPEVRSTGHVPDRPHLVVIPKPPEWQAAEGDSESSDSQSDSDGEEIPNDTTAIGGGGGGAGAASSTQLDGASNPERGILVSFPHLDLHGIELLEIGTLNIIVKCDRCKDTKDITGLRHLSAGATPRSESCKKCAFPYSIGYRAEFMHANSVRAGYLDLDGCTVVDMLPSSFIPTCAECSTEYARTGVVSVRGETSMAFCRQCHRKMTFRLPEIKFLRISASAVRASQAPRPKKRSENLGIVAGTELTNRGRCSHYKKSYRWFRFSCCNKVFPCDRCHDQAESHDLEHANRMICGFCSREQNYRPKDCGICHAWLTVRPSKGFWEGGQGTRDQRKMSRKDPRKYKRIQGSKSAT